MTVLQKRKNANEEVIVLAKHRIPVLRVVDIVVKTRKR